MTLRRTGVLLVFGLSVALWGCATGSGEPEGPVVSPTGIVYEPGIPPTRTRFSQTAALYLRQGQVSRAAELAREGIESDPENPIHYYLAGRAQLRLGEYEEADEMFSEAQRIYPAYELEIEPEREAAWAEAFNEGAEAYAEGDVEGAVEAWERATVIYDLRPQAHRNLASLLVEEGRYDEAIRVYEGTLEGLEKRPATRVLEEEEVERRAEVKVNTERSLAQLLLFRNRFAEAEPLLRRQLERDPASTRLQSDLATALTGQGKEEEAAEIYSALLAEPDLEATQLFNLGIALFRAADYSQAAQAFQRLTELRPDSRDAWFNYANSLFAAQNWETLARVGERLIELDPLSENVALIVARAHLEAGDPEAASRGLERAETAPVHLEGLQMRPSGRETSIQGRVAGNNAEPGTPVRLRFVFYGGNGSGALGSELVTLRAPPPGESESFEVSFGQRAAAYRYEWVR